MVYRLQVVDGNAQDTLNKVGVYAFIVLNLIGGLGMVVMLIIAALSSKVKRLPTWYSFCVSWAMSTASYLLLFITAEQFTQTPIFYVCYVQASLIYAMPPTTTSTTLALLVQILLSFPDVTSDRPKKASLLASVMLIMIPYTIFLFLFVGVSAFHTMKPDSLQKSHVGTYCDSSDSAWLRVSFSLVAGISLLILIVQALLIKKLYQSMRVLKSNPQSTATTIRGIVFTLLGFVSMVLAIFFVLVDKNDLPFDIILSTFPVLALLVFGTQKDMFAWLLWKSTTPYKSEGRGSVFFGKDQIRV
ncbi:hypothetical protein BDN70DRAFT_878297 [Pholiota conissans]|uniref:Uncharacterized protein n=1 Tax=Pholiota conissans TaxID=109636 RepID=A0A9P6CTX5_9AGAR|nr:hypothetical protein BDN70DRAFT_878297 [Pholiota conissans]